MKHDDPNAKILKLTVSREPFEVMVTGEKAVEFRQKSKWIESRLYRAGLNKEYHFVKIANGYSKNSPYFIAKWKFANQIDPYDQSLIKYSNGMIVDKRDYSYAIHLGEIVEKGNLK